jgi:hypothetical protein
VHMLSRAYASKDPGPAVGSNEARSVSSNLLVNSTRAMYRTLEQATGGGAPQPAASTADARQIALDGQAYTWPQYVEAYGDDAQRCWEDAYDRDVAAEIPNDSDASQLAVNAYGEPQPIAAIDQGTPQKRARLWCMQPLPVVAPSILARWWASRPAGFLLPTPPTQAGFEALGVAASHFQLTRLAHVCRRISRGARAQLELACDRLLAACPSFGELTAQPGASRAASPTAHCELDFSIEEEILRQRDAEDEADRLARKWRWNGEELEFFPTPSDHERERAREFERMYGVTPLRQ